MITSIHPTGNLLVITVKCIDCGIDIILHVPQVSWTQWKQGDKKIQDALPELTIDEREILISGLCGNCFDAMFSVEDEDELSEDDVAF